MLRTKSAFAALAAALALGATVLCAGPTEAIVGGSAVANGAYPFMASVQSGGSHFCGGSVIANDWVLTAAHCVTEGESGLSVRVGSIDNTTGGTVINVNAVHVDPAFDGTYYDVALLHLAQAVPGNVSTIALAPLGDDTHAITVPREQARYEEAPTKL
jgi:secreted trypsin-like serine protease